MICFYFPFPNVCRDWSQNHSTVSADIKKLPSGGRIKRAGDDAAGLAISEKMRAQIIRLETAQKKANDGISLLQTAEDALNKVHLILDSMAKLAEKVVNGACQDGVAHENLQKEIALKKDELARISKPAGFNGIRLPVGFLSGGEGGGDISSATTVSNTFVHIDQNNVLYIDTRALGIFDIDISTREGAVVAVELIKKAISSIEKNLEDIQNRLRAIVKYMTIAESQFSSVGNTINIKA